MAQIALALTLLIVSGLMIRTFVAHAAGANPASRGPRRCRRSVSPFPEGLIGDREQAARTYESIAERLEQVPGVTSVGLSSSITMDGEDNGNAIDVEGFPVPDGHAAAAAALQERRARLLRDDGQPPGGGALDHVERDLRAAARHRDLRSAGARVLAGAGEGARQARAKGAGDDPWREIVGVVGDERDDGLNQPATAIVYWPLLNDSYRRRTMAYAVRSTRVGTPGFMRELQQAVWSVNPNLPLAAVQTLEEIQSRSMAQTSFAMVMLAIAAGVALLLGVVGIYGVIAYIVDAADPRDRHPHGARRADRRRAADVPPPGPLADGRRHRARHRASRWR